MPVDFSRRGFLYGAAGLGALPLLRGQHSPARAPEFAIENNRRSVVSLVKGEERRKTVAQALEAIDDQIKPVLKRKKYVLIKPNNVSTTNQLAATHADTLHGILDYLAPRFKGPVIVAESSAGHTMEGFDNFKYTRVAANASPSG